MGDRFASSKNALGMCDVCGFQYKLRQLKTLVIKGIEANIKACPECWNPSQPQLMLGTFPVDDPQAIRNPRPDTSLGVSGIYSSRDINWGWNPVGGGDADFNQVPNPLVATTGLGTVTVTTN